jgi:hypothetical protein
MKQRRVASQSVSPSTNFVGAAVYLNTGPEKEDFQGKVYAAIDKASEMSKKMYSKVIRMWSVADGASVFVKEIQTEKCIGALEAVSLNNDQNGILVIFKDGEMVMYNAELDDSVMICPSESHLLVKHSLVIHEQQAHLLMLLTGRSKNEQLAQSLSLQCSQGQWTIQQIQSMEVTLSSLDYVSLNAKSNTVAIMDQSSFELYPMNAPSRTVSVSILDNQRLLAFEYLSTNHILFITENSKKERHLIIADAHFGTLQGKQLLNDASQMTTKSSCYPALLVSELQKDEAQVIVSTVIKTSKHLECDIDMCPIYVPRFTLLSALGKSEPSTCQFSLVEEKYNPKSKILSVETVPVAKNQLVEQLVAGLSDFDLRFINTMDNCEGLFVPPHHIQRLLSIVFNPETINKCWYRESAQWMIQHGWTSSLSAPEADILDCLLEKKEWFLLADYLKSKTLSAAHLAKVIQQIIRQECLNDFKLYVQSLTEVESMKSKSAQWFYLNMVIESSKDEVLLARSLRKTLTHEDVQTIMNIVDDILASKKNRFELLVTNSSDVNFGLGH